LIAKQRPPIIEDAMSANSHEEAHTGPIKNPKQLLLAVFFSFVVPVFAIIGLVYYVVSAAKPAGVTGDKEVLALSGMTEKDHDQGIADRLRKVGLVEIRDANRALKSGDEVFKAQCATCHTAGVAGAPKVGDAAAWAPRLKSGFDTLLHSALKGKGAMGAQGGGDFEDLEIARAVVYMANASGGKLAEPQKPAAAASAPQEAVSQAATPATK
jgi:cytochrome c5